MTIIINYKTYERASGKKALALAQALEKYRKDNVMIAAQNSDIYRISQKVKIPVLGQHADAITPGRNTGFSLPESLKFNGACGSLINHSEHRISLEDIKFLVKRFKELRMKSVVCVRTLAKAKKVKRFKPDFIALEDKNLIGTGRSISTYNSAGVRAFCKLVPNGLIGAGISTREDIVESKALGAKGVLLASAIANHPRPKKKLKELFG